LTQVFKKSWYEGYQSQNWKNILQHDLFDEPLAELSYDWVISQKEQALLNGD
jgi:hypothetical protein